MPAWCQARHARPMSSRSVTANHALVAGAGALKIQAWGKTLAAMMASLPCRFPSPPTIIGSGNSRPGRPLRRLEVVLGGLQGEQFGVLAAQREQVGVHAMLDDLPVAQHVDPVRVLD